MQRKSDLGGKNKTKGNTCFGDYNNIKLLLVTMKARQSFPPLVWEDSEILILGTIPSSSSIEKGEYYFHYANSIWDYLAEIFHESRPRIWSEKTDFLKRHRIALWDVYAFSDVVGSLDKGLRDFNDISGFLDEHAIITKILLNGKKTAQSLEKYEKKKSKLPKTVRIYALPSTSGANTKIPRKMVLSEWEKALLETL